MRIIEIDQFGPLYESGVRATDIIIEINDTASSWANLTESLKSLTFGDIINLKIISSNGEIKEIAISSDDVEKFS